MTVIAFKDGILAGDSCVAEDDMNVGTMRKVVKTPGGWLAGAAGNVSTISRFLAWAQKDFNKRSRPKVNPDDDFQGIAIRRDGMVFFYDGSWEGYSRVQAPYHAIGSGSVAALIAMDCGHTAEEAALKACARVHGCAPPILTVKLKD